MADLTFDQLQTRLVPLWKSIERMKQDEQTVVIAPSLTIDCTTEIERDLAVALGIPMYGADPKHFHFGTKTTSSSPSAA